MLTSQKKPRSTTFRIRARVPEKVAGKRFFIIEILQIILAQVFPLNLEPGHQEDSVAISHFLDTYWEANEHILKTIRLAQDSGRLTREVSEHTILQTLRGYIFGLWAGWKKHTPPRDSIAGFVDRFFLMYRGSAQPNPE